MPMTRLEQLQKLAQVDPRDPITRYALGLEYFNLEQWDQAIAAFDEAIAIDPRYQPAFHHKARAELRAKRHDAARATLATGIALARAAGDRHAEAEMREMLEALP
jgi:tetratricopeptide (TPR) repeat protein